MPFGPGSTTKPNVLRLNRKELSMIAHTATGTNQTATRGYDSTYGDYLISTLGGADNDEGSLTLPHGAIVNPTVGDRYELESLVKLTEGATDDMDFGFGAFDTLENLFSDSPGTPVTSADFLTVHKIAGSLFWRAGAGNDASQKLSGATATAMASGTWYRLRIEAEVRQDGLHARFYVDGTLIYTIGYDSTVAALSVTSLVSMYIGFTHKCTSGAAEIVHYIPTVTKVEQSGN